MFSRSELAIRLLRLSRLKQPTNEAGLIIIQIDGLSLTQFGRARQKRHIPFMEHLLRDERYTLHTFYSGLPSNTPAVQAEIFYGVKGCVPAFNFIDRKLGKIVKMMDPGYVEYFQKRFKKEDGLLTGGSAYSNIFTGGAEEAHYCWAKLGTGDILRAINPLVFPFFVLLYIDIFIRTFILFVIEVFLAILECIRGTLKGRVFLKELELIWIRALVCVFMREMIVAGACIDIMRGLPVIHMNFLGYDEQSHCRGPASRFAHWSLQGIDNAIRRIHKVASQSFFREYDLWIYGDHGQEKTTPYIVQHGITIQEAVDKLFKTASAPRPKPVGRKEILVRLWGEKKGPATVHFSDAPEQKENTAIEFGEQAAIVTAMGPLGEVYVKKKMEKEELEFYAGKLVSEVKIPLVMRPEGTDKAKAWTPHGTFLLPDQIAEVFGEDHPFLEEMKEDVVRICQHPDAGEYILAGWSKGESLISLSLEFGAHAGMGPEETKSFAILPMDAPVDRQEKMYLRPIDIRKTAQNFMRGNRFPSRSFPIDEATKKPLRLMSYNVHGCLGMDGTISTERIARVIARHHPDVVALQELDVGRKRSDRTDQVGKLAKNLGMNYHFHPAVRYEEEQYGNAILSRYPLTLMKMGPLPRFADKRRYEARGAIWAAIEYQGMKVQIINTHLSLWPQERLMQITTLLNQEWLGHPNCYGPMILCGDLNALPSSRVYRQISGRLRDTQAILEGHRPSRTWFGRYPLSQIDYIFVSPEFKVNAVVVPRTSLEKIASDHLPLFVELKL